jgi:hypothetical protein
VDESGATRVDSDTNSISDYRSEAAPGRLAVALAFAALEPRAVPLAELRPAAGRARPAGVRACWAAARPRAGSRIGACERLRREGRGLCDMDFNAALALSIVNLCCMVFFFTKTVCYVITAHMGPYVTYGFPLYCVVRPHGRALRLTAKNCVFQPGQWNALGVFGAARSQEQGGSVVIWRASDRSERLISVLLSLMVISKVVCVTCCRSGG